MTKQTFEIIDGVYVGPSVYSGSLDLREYKDTLISLGSLKKVKGSLVLKGCTNLVSLGSLKKVGGSIWLKGCTSLTSLGSLREAGSYLDLEGCTSLTSLGSLKEVRDWFFFAGCTSLTSLGSLTKVGGGLELRGCTNLVSLGSLKEVGSGVFSVDGKTSLQEVQKKICYYTSLSLHEALNALHIQEVQNVPLYKNILLQKLQGG